MDNKNKCSFDPRTVHGPIGMFHCPECGEMQLAGLPHIAYMDDYEDAELLKTTSPDDESGDLETF